jgi:hypothetical protein
MHGTSCQIQWCKQNAFFSDTINSMVFPRLESVEGTLSVTAAPFEDGYFPIFDLAADRTPHPPLDIDLPALATTGGVIFTGNISR